ncbi:helix-turn-helix domain-containing protein [Halocatena halophila]|uniref:helix-turn-helix domain-containing protein n=1 Tax=Halocatena halophila TaxID=2814576 RepID=UPI002ED0C5BC
MEYISFIVPPIEDESDSEMDHQAVSMIEPVATYYLNLLDDGTTVELSHIRNDPEHIRDALETDPRVLSYDVVPETSGGLVYIHSRASELVNDVLTILVRHKLVVDWPITYTTHGGHRVTVLGKDTQIRRTIEELPDTIQTILEGIGNYRPEIRQPLSLLTGRQRQILELAVEMGYYEIPRHTTLGELGKALQITAGTVGEHLRKIESKIILNHVR